MNEHSTIKEDIIENDPDENFFIIAGAFYYSNEKPTLQVLIISNEKILKGKDYGIN